MGLVPRPGPWDRSLTSAESRRIIVIPQRENLRETGSVDPSTRCDRPDRCGRYLMLADSGLPHERIRDRAVGGGTERDDLRARGRAEHEPCRR